MAEPVPESPVEKKDAAAAPSAAKAKTAQAAAAARESLRKGMGAAKKVFGRFASVPGAILRVPLLLLRGDVGTRLAVLGLVAGIALVASTGLPLYQRFSRVARDAATGPEKKSEIAADFDVFLKARQERLQAIENLVFLEGFSAHMNAGPGIVRMFEVEIFVECDKPETAAWVKSHLAQSKDAVSSVLQAKTYEQLLTEDGKDRFKAEIVTSLNTLIRKSSREGKVVRAYFSHLVMGT